MFEDFWIFLQQSGETPERDSYSVTDDDRLLIQSLSNKNKNYHFSREIAERYMTEDIPNMTESEFRHNRSSYFLNVFNHYQKGRTSRSS